MDWDEKALLALLAADMESHYKHLVGRYQDELYAFILSKTRNKEDAQDIVQEGFWRAYQALSGYSPQRILALKTRPWLYKVTVNVCHNYLGRYKPPPSVSLDLSDDAADLSIADRRQEQPDVLLELVETRRELEALVELLPDRYRDAVRLHYLDDFAYDEIADILQQDSGTVRVKVHRGIRLLRQILAQHPLEKVRS